MSSCRVSPVKNDGWPRRSKRGFTTSLDTYPAAAGIRNLQNAEPQKGKSVRWSSQSTRKYTYIHKVQNLSVSSQVAKVLSTTVSCPRNLRCVCLGESTVPLMFLRRLIFSPAPWPRE